MANCSGLVAKATDRGESVNKSTRHEVTISLVCYLFQSIVVLTVRYGVRSDQDDQRSAIPLFAGNLSRKRQGAHAQHLSGSRRWRSAPTRRRDRPSARLGAQKGSQ